MAEDKALDDSLVVRNMHVDHHLDKGCLSRALDLGGAGLLAGVVAGGTVALLRPAAGVSIASRLSKMGGVGLFTGAATASSWCAVESFRERKDWINAAVGGAAGAAFLAHVGAAATFPGTLWAAAAGSVALGVADAGGFTLAQRTEFKAEQFKH